MAPTVILASGSAVRQRLLEDAGVDHRVITSGVDETPLKMAARDQGETASETAHKLALAKALAVSDRNPGALVIGADQILTCDDRWFDKPADLEQARETLRALSGRTHHLVGGAVVVEDRNIVWRREDSLPMTMRRLSDGFIDTYLEAVGNDACLSVGAYQLEGLGAQLFERIDGDFFTILGLPLLPLLDFLRQRDAVGS